jgi:threonine/homoserine/homoserine lactone efflux protein
MTLHSYLLFVGASIVLVFVPGPDMAYLLARSVAQGRKAGVLAALGINAGAYVHLIAAVSGLSALLMTSALAFSAVKAVGALYLIWLGVGALRLKAEAEAGPLPPVALRGAGARAVFWQGFLSDALNPKVAMFYLAFLPQFVDPHAGGVWAGRPWLQFLVLGLTCNMIALPFNIPLALLAGHASQALRGNPKVSAWLRKAMGATFLGLGLKLAAERAPSAALP